VDEENQQENLRFAHQVPLHLAHKRRSLITEVRSHSKRKNY